MTESEEDPSERSDGSASDDDSDSDPVELLVAGRERRKTAGNRYDRDMVLEQVGDDEEPDEVALLFANDDADEDDEEFRSSDPDDDAEMSSDDDDDQGPNTGADDLDGEKELQTQAKTERAKKRKAELALTSTAGLRKRPRLDPMRGVKTGPAKPTKKKERIDWLSGTASSSGRTSLRKQTIAHREITMARLRETEAQTAKMRALKEQRDKERSKEVVRELTQADRLAEAERVERRNAKSLNRWEAMEKKRAEEQAAKLAALKNRQLQGAVISWWSGKGVWIPKGPENSDSSKPIPTPNIKPEPKKRGRKPKGFWEQLAAAKEAENHQKIANLSPQPRLSEGASENESIANQTSIPELTNDQGKRLSVSSQTPQATTNLLAGIEEYSTASSNMPETPAHPDRVPPDSAVDADKLEQGKPSVSLQGLPPPTADFKQEASQTTLPDRSTTALEDERGSAVSESVTNPDQTQPAPVTIQPAPVLATEYTTRNLVILEKFNDLPNEAKQEFAVFYHNRKPNKFSKHTFETCAMTGLPIRYKDPATGIGYANVAGYKKLKDLRKHNFIWSSMLGCYVGKAGIVAHGVPEGFLGT